MKVLSLILTVVFALGAAETSSARPKHRVEAPGMTRDDGGTPIIMQGLERPKRPVPDDDHPKQRAERPRMLPRGSSGYYLPPIRPPSGGPASALVIRPSPAPYKPPPINSFSDRATQCVHSFPLNAGMGNNPVDRDAYVRSCVNN